MSVTLAILAGGKGVRMGMPKSHLLFEGRPILHYLLERFHWSGGTLLVTGIGNEHPAGWEKFDAEATDAVADQGPLRGILTALDNATTDLVALVTVDMPAAGREMVEYLIEKVAADPRAMGAMYERQDGGRRIEPFPCVLRRSLRDVVARRIALERRSVQGLSEEGIQLVSPKACWDAGMWRNLNSPGDLL
jgi:molybdopterin-guanine dinucleotide biosynthesis protein A